MRLISKSVSKLSNLTNIELTTDGSLEKIIFLTVPSAPLTSPELTSRFFLKMIRESTPSIKLSDKPAVLEILSFLGCFLN